MTATYVRSTGGHVAERERPAAGSARAGELEALAADPATDWRVESPAAAEPKRPAKSASKAERSGA